MYDIDPSRSHANASATINRCQNMRPMILIRNKIHSRLNSVIIRVHYFCPTSLFIPPLPWISNQTEIFHGYRNTYLLQMEMRV